jgi:hypothetical protein
LGDTFDPSYAPVLKAGTEVTGAGKVFSLLDDMDFNNPYNSLGISNRKILPVHNANQQVVAYNVTKREIVFNGVTKIFSKTIRSVDFKPFMQVVLPDNDVISIEQVIVKPGISNPTPTIDDFFDESLRYYEVDYLLQDKIFIDDTSNSEPDQLKAGKYQKVTKKFIKEFTPNGFCKVTFGGGNGDVDLFTNAMNNGGVYNGIDGYLQNTAFGDIPPVDNQIFFRYRTGGGVNSNVGSNVLTNLGNVDFYISGEDNQKNLQVKKSLKVNNPIPALGGADAPTIEEIRNAIKFNYAAQNRCVTLNDYLIQIFKFQFEYLGRNKYIRKINNLLIISNF